MRQLLLCSGVYGKKTAIEGLRRLAFDRRPEAVLFAGGILSPQRSKVPCSTSLWGLTPEDERFAFEFGAALAALKVFCAVIHEPNFVPEDQFCRLAMAIELEFPSVHLVHATLVETHDLAVCGLGAAIAEPALMREDSYCRAKAQYFFAALRASEKPRKVLLLPEPPPGPLGGLEGNVIVGDLIDWLRPNLCVVSGPTERRGLQRIASTLIVNPGHLADGSAAWLDWGRGDEVEFLDCNTGAVIRENSPCKRG